MSTITVRRLDANWEPQWGNGQDNFITDIDAVAQIIAQRLKLLQAEWWEDQTIGLPFWQKIAGYAGQGNNPNAASLIIQQQILDTPYVTGLSNLTVVYNPSNRSYNFTAIAQTQFGQIAITNNPSVPSRALPS